MDSKIHYAVSENKARSQMLHITDANVRHSTQLSDLNSNTHQPSMQNNNSIKSFTTPSSSTLANSACLKPNVPDGNSGSIYSMADMLGSELYDQSIYSKPTKYISNYSPHDNVASPAFHSGYHHEITANGAQITPNALYSQPRLTYTYFSPPHPHGIVDTQPQEIMMSKDKERSNSVNAAFSTLRMLIPTDPCDRKLSKIETLRLAKSYISHLHTVLTAGWEDDQPCLNRDKYLRCLVGKPEDGPTAICTFCLSSSKRQRHRKSQPSKRPASRPRGGPQVNQDT